MIDYQSIFDQDVLEHIAALFDIHGADAWYAMSNDALLPANTKYNPDDLEKISDILDVWFDSGSTWNSVLSSGNYDAGQYPASLYIEGSDQHRGWFQSSLLLSAAVNEVSPYKTLITHGFTVDNKGEKMSKSKGNVIAPDKVIKQYGSEIYTKRKGFLETFTPIFEERYKVITKAKEKVKLEYKTQLDENRLTTLLEDVLEKDRMLQYTSVGIHKDDLLFNIDGFSVKKFGSQGQQKSFLIALKLAQFEFIKNLAQKKPILLLDDIFDKLDDNRVAQIVDLVNQDNFGQLFISDTHKDRTEDVVKKTNQSYKIFKL